MFNIYTDSQTSYNMFQSEYYPTTNENYIIMQQIYFIMNILNQDGINFNIYKVKSHVHNQANKHQKLNNRVDYIARTETLRTFTELNHIMNIFLTIIIIM